MVDPLSNVLRTLPQKSLHWNFVPINLGKKLFSLGYIQKHLLLSWYILFVFSENDIYIRRKFYVIKKHLFFAVTKIHVWELRKLMKWCESEVSPCARDGQKITIRNDPASLSLTRKNIVLASLLDIEQAYSNRLNYFLYYNFKSTRSFLNRL